MGEKARRGLRMVVRMSLLKSLVLALLVALPLVYLGFWSVYLEPNMLLWSQQMRLNFTVFATPFIVFLMIFNSRPEQ